MKTENRYYDIAPKVVLAGARTTVVIRPKFDHVGFDGEKTYQATLSPAEFFVAAQGDARLLEVELDPADGCIKLTYLFSEEQEYVLELLDASGKEPAVILRALLYAVREDLYGRRPYKGDLHIHSFRSDGKESPAFVAASCRRAGFDFMALTDHGQYAPSIESQEGFAGVELGLLICRGEEVHPPGNPVHMVNFGGSFSVNELIARDEEAYLRAVGEVEKTVSDVERDEVRHQLASCIWVFEQIRQGGGLGIFCHPYWHVRWGYTPSEPVTATVFDKQPFDAYEVLGGYARDAVDSNTLQVARYHEERARGKKIPIVGVSDAHGCENSDLFGWYYTIVFAEQLAKETIVENVKSLRSVAVEAIPGEAIRAYGPLRLVKYALFLVGEILPEHDELCLEEGRLMMDYLSGDREAQEELAVKRERCEKLFSRCLGGP